MPTFFATSKAPGIDIVVKLGINNPKQWKAKELKPKRCLVAIGNQ